MNRNRANFGLNVAEGVSFQMGMGFISPAGILPLFVAGLTHAPWALGLMGALFMLGALPQALGAVVTARARNFLQLAYVQTLVPRIALVALATAPWLPAPIALAGFFILLGLFQLAMGFATPTWLEFVHRALPDDRRGAFFGVRKAWGAVLSLASMGLAGILVANLAAPYSFRVCFMAAALCWLVTYPLMLATTVPDVLPPKSPISVLTTARAMWSDDEEFRRYLIGRCALAAASMATAFYAVYGVTEAHLPTWIVPMLPIAMSVIPSIAGPRWGSLIDRLGARKMLVPLALLAAVAHIVMLVAPSTLAFLVALVAIGTAGVVVEIADGQFLLGMGAGRCGVATSVMGLVLLPINFGAPLLAGLLATAAGLSSVIALAGVAWFIGALALVVVAPRTAPALTRAFS